MKVIALLDGSWSSSAPHTHEDRYVDICLDIRLDICLDMLARPDKTKMNPYLSFGAGIKFLIG